MLEQVEVTEERDYHKADLYNFYDRHTSPNIFMGDQLKKNGIRGECNTYGGQKCT